MAYTDDLKAIDRFTTCVERWLINTKRIFRRINDEGLPAEDRKRLKEYYLEDCVTPQIRELVRQYFPEEFKTDQHTGPARSNQRSSQHTNQ